MPLAQMSMHIGDLRAPMITREGCDLNFFVWLIAYASNHSPELMVLQGELSGPLGGGRFGTGNMALQYASQARQADWFVPASSIQSSLLGGGNFVNGSVVFDPGILMASCNLSLFVSVA